MESISTGAMMACSVCGCNSTTDLCHNCKDLSEENRRLVREAIKSVVSNLKPVNEMFKKVFGGK